MRLGSNLRLYFVAAALLVVVGLNILHDFRASASHQPIRHSPLHLLLHPRAALTSGTASQPAR